MRASLPDQNMSNCMTVFLESATFEVYNPEGALQLWWEAKLRKLGGKRRGETRRSKKVVRSENVDVIEVDGNEEEDHEEEERHEDYFYDSPSKDKGKYARKKDTGRNFS